MTLFYEEMAKVFILLILSIFFVVHIICILSFNNFKPDTEKIVCLWMWFDPYEDARNVFWCSFYLVAILFIIFDLEAVYFFLGAFLLVFK
jgi:NADH:ubiquinone oxidoreductase subunit 3 (subunit A)